MASDKTLLDVLEQQVKVDVDWMDADFIKSIAFKFHDMTSNQAIVHENLSLLKNRHLLEQAATELKGQEGKTWLDVYTRAAALLCAQVIPHLSGRVLLQTRPSEAYDTAATVAYARHIDSEFARIGIDRSRYAIKIPVTGPAMVAAHILQQSGIETLGTIMFNVPQAFAAAQANCLYVSPYYEELAAHADKSLRPTITEAATEHPMSGRLWKIIQVLDNLRNTGKGQIPKVKLASLVTENEVFAAGGLKCDSVTVPPALLSSLAAKKGTEEERKKVQAYTVGDAEVFAGLAEGVDLPGGGGGVTKEEADRLAGVDWLAGGGKEVEEAMARDPEGSRRLKDSLTFFQSAEERSKKMVEDVLAQVWGGMHDVLVQVRGGGDVQG